MGRHLARGEGTLDGTMRQANQSPQRFGASSNIFESVVTCKISISWSLPQLFHAPHWARHQLFQGPHSFWHQLFHSPHCGMHQLFQGPHPCAEAEEDPPALNANERLANAKAAINLLRDIFTFMVVSRGLRGVSVASLD